MIGLTFACDLDIECGVENSGKIIDQNVVRPVFMSCL